MAVAKNDPEWIPVIRACFDYGDVSQFKRKWVFDGYTFPVTLEPLIRMNVLKKAAAAGADKNADYSFVDRGGVGRALDELAA